MEQAGPDHLSHGAPISIYRLGQQRDGRTEAQAGLLMTKDAFLPCRKMS